MNTVKNSVGVWAFGPAVTRFVPPGYHPEVANEGMVEKTKRVCEGLSDLLDGLEYRSPGVGDELALLLQEPAGVFFQIAGLDDGMGHAPSGVHDVQLRPGLVGEVRRGLRG